MRGWTVLLLVLLSLSPVRAAAQQKGEVLGKHENTAAGLAVSPDGKTVATSGHVDCTVRLWDLATKKELHKLQGHRAGVLGVAFSPDGKTLASAGLEEALIVTDVATGKEVQRMTVPGHPYAVAFSPDGKNLVSSGIDRTVRVWEVATGKETAQLAGHQGRIWGVAWSPGGKYLASGCEVGTVRVWEVATGRQVFCLSDNMIAVVPVAFSPDGKVLASGNADKTIRLWDVATGKELTRFTGHKGLVHSLSFSRDGRMLASGGYEDQTIRLWELATGKEVCCLEGHEGPILSVALTPDGRSILSTSKDTTVRVWDATRRMKDGKLKVLEATKKELETLWNELGEEDAEKAHAAVWSLAAAPKEALALLKDKLRPAAAASDADKEIAKLVAELNGEKFGVRERATDRLRKLGRLAERQLRKVLEDTDSAEVRVRVQALLSQMEGPFVASDAVQAVRAVWVLEELAGDDARQLLETLARGVSQATLTMEAKAALKRLSARKGAP